MRVLLAFATYSSGTDLATNLVVDVFTKNNIKIEKKDIREVTFEDLHQANVIIFASPSWRTRKGDGQPHEFFLDFIERMEGQTLPGKLFAIVGLGDTAYTNFCGAVDVLENFVKGLQGTLIYPSLRIDGFYFNQAENEQKIKNWAHNLHSSL